MRVINIFGAPGVGKSTAASGLLYLMKREGEAVEFALEYAKDLIYEKHGLEDQLMILAQQHKRLQRLSGKVDWVITDAPLLMSAMFNADITSPTFKILVKELFDDFDNINIILIDRKFEYSNVGRITTEKDSYCIEDWIKEQFRGKKRHFIESDWDVADKIYNMVINKGNK